MTREDMDGYTVSGYLWLVGATTVVNIFLTIM